MLTARTRRHAIRRLTAFASGTALALGLIASATSAQATVSGAAIDPSVFLPGSSPQVRVSWTESSAAATSGSGSGAFGDPTGGNYLSLEVGWGWNFSKKNPSNTAVSYSATWVAATSPATGGAFECRDGGVTFASFASAGLGISSGTALTCLVRRSNGSSSNPGQQVVLSNTGSNHFTLVAGSEVTVTFPADVVTAPASGPASDTWRIISLGTTTNANTLIANGQTTTVSTTVPAVDATGAPLPIVTIDFDANGGTCQTAKATGYASTWAKAPSASDCSKPDGTFIGWNTSADGSGIGIQPEGWINFTSDNRVYAQYISYRVAGAPTNVTAVPSRNQVKVSWQAPADPGSGPITNYLAQATPSGKICITRLSDADMLSCTFDLPATNTKYSFKVQALNNVGWGNFSTESTAVSPYGFGEITASRPNILLGLGGSKVEASGSAPGLAGKAVNAEYKVGSESAWTTQANAATVNAEGKFSWSRKFGPLQNKKNVTVRFTYGSDAVSGSYVLARGSEAGSLTVPRNVKVENVVNRVIVTWDPPKFDGGEKIIGYTMCAKGSGSLCRNVPAEGRGVFQNLATGRDYTITVAARTATRTGPEAAAKQKVSPVEASVQITSRSGEVIKVETRAIGFKSGAKFRLEVAVADLGKPASTWRWDELQSFTSQGNVNRGFAQELGASYQGETITVRLVTPNGPAYSRVSRP